MRIMKHINNCTEAVQPMKNASVTTNEVDKPLSISKEQLIQVIAAALPYVDKLPKEPKGETTSEKQSNAKT
ncbi:hypothetical protein DVP95_22065 [Yersinia enterocolitica]|nr:hypothetical protein [Yersinia enterocolitica]EKN6335441.1 hypothetical protein [Yersinia enterocolitica]